MNILIKFALLSMLTAVPEIITAQGPQPVEPWFSVTITGPKASVSAGSDVKLKVVLVNNTEQDIRYAGAGGPGRNGPAFDIGIRDSGGKPAPETPYALRCTARTPRRGAAEASLLGPHIQATRLKKN